LSEAQKERIDKIYRHGELAMAILIVHTVRPRSQQTNKENAL